MSEFFLKLKGKLAIVKGNLFTRVNALIQEAISNGISYGLTEDEIVSVAKQIFDNFIRPIDFPYIQEPLETKIEDIVWSLAEKTIRAAVKN